MSIWNHPGAADLDREADELRKRLDREATRAAASMTAPAPRRGPAAGGPRMPSPVAGVPVLGRVEDAAVAARAIDVDVVAVTASDSATPASLKQLVWDLEATGAELVVPALFRQQRIGLNALRRRLFVKPGLTGRWQVSGRNDLTIDQGTRLDLYYVENWSLLGDIAILLRTAREIFAPSGAY